MVGKNVNQVEDRYCDQTDKMFNIFSLISKMYAAMK